MELVCVYHQAKVHERISFGKMAESCFFFCSPVFRMLSQLLHFSCSFYRDSFTFPCALLCLCDVNHAIFISWVHISIHSEYKYTCAPFYLARFLLHKQRSIYSYGLLFLFFLLSLFLPSSSSSSWLCYPPLSLFVCLYIFFLFVDVIVTNLFSQNIKTLISISYT